uniref:DUF5667 domain-containing protein n=1 Tax=Candidatus Kentrum sp. FM TaxID=2126340 RepID=A0A450VNH4_9GAMM|nr:MAG: hypothetical protein BECKFM1743C_GA0114222_100148 [Candidatus Kentron sp. FM]VFJ53505.1 MAG: hypothetical protein BECKFM1743A_GA0114220_101158 [Candidatus Kentron sp. FM]VFK06335.1 MAG: hypothetical protein BECKFM1743B_GA0114221_1001410 [Candidatus Kentron sp. FM]
MTIGIRTIFIALIFIAFPCLAQEPAQQSAQEPYEFSAADVAAKLSAMLGDEGNAQVYEDSLRRLEQASEAFSPKEKQAVLERLKAEETTIEQAEADFDKMMADIQQTQDLGDPDGEFVQFMNKMQLKASEEASAAEKDRDSEFVKAFTTLAGEFEKIRDRAIEARNQAIPAIDFLKQNKRKYVRAKKLRAFAQISLIADEAVSKAEEQSQAVRAAASALRNALDPAMPR